MSAYDDLILTDNPALYLPLDGSTTSADGRTATVHGSPAVQAGALPNGDTAVVFDGSTTQWIELPDSADLSVSTTGALTVEAWLRPDALTMPHTEGTGYVHWLGKLTYDTTNQCEWVARIYSADNTEGRSNRISGYAFNAAGGLGAGSYFQDALTPGEWIHYALVINTTPSSTYPTGYTKLYRDGVLRDQDSLSGYSIVPTDTTSPMRIGSADLRGFLRGAVAKVAVYPVELAASQLAAHHSSMLVGQH